MAVQLPTAADVRKAREQGADVARTPLLAALGAGDYAYTTVTKTVTHARVRATTQAEELQHRVASCRSASPPRPCARSSRSCAPRPRSATPTSPAVARAPGAACASSRR
jgi:hypothetical protein